MRKAIATHQQAIAKTFGIPHDEKSSGVKKTVEQLIVELTNFAGNKKIRFFDESRELKICEYDQDENGNPTFFLEPAE